MNNYFLSVTGDLFTWLSLKGINGLISKFTSIKRPFR
jgi:hypothetical protein